MEITTPLRVQTVVMMVDRRASPARTCIASAVGDGRLMIERGGMMKREAIVQADCKQQGEKENVTENKSLIQRQHGRSPDECYFAPSAREIASLQTRTRALMKGHGKLVLASTGKTIQVTPRGRSRFNRCSSVAPLSCAVACEPCHQGIAA